jgi:phage tail-like protein
MRITGIAGVALVAAASIASAGPLGPNSRAYVAGKYMLDLDGINAGWLKSIEGGHATADVVNEPAGPNAVVKKHIGTPKYEDFTMQMGMGMSPEFYEWVTEFFEGQAPRKDGAVIAASFDSRRIGTHAFQDALITEFTIPTLDGSSKDPAFMSLKVTPETTEFTPGDGSAVVTPLSPKTKVWQAANFRFVLGSLPCQRVAKIDSFTLKQAVKRDEPGEERQYRNEPGTLEVPNLVLSISNADLQPWNDWHKKFVIDGQNSDSDELEGSLSFLAADGTVLARIDLRHVGIWSLAPLPPPPPDSDAGASARFTVGLYVEAMEFLYMPKPENE